MHIQKQLTEFETLAFPFASILFAALATDTSNFQLWSIHVPTLKETNKIPFSPQWYAPLSVNVTLPKQQILDSSRLKEFAFNNFNFDENGRKFSKQEENTVGKEEIARCKQFLLFPLCFQKTCTADT